MKKDHKAREYTRFPFGKYKGVYIKDMPDDYLEWCSKNLVSEQYRYTILQLVIEEIEHRHFNRRKITQETVEPPRKKEKPMKVSGDDLFRRLRDLTKKLQHLNELKAPPIIVEDVRLQFDDALKELKLYYSTDYIEREMASKWLNRRWKDKHDQH